MDINKNDEKKLKAMLMHLLKMYDDDGQRLIEYLIDVDAFNESFIKDIICDSKITTSTVNITPTEKKKSDYTLYSNDNITFTANIDEDSEMIYYSKSRRSKYTASEIAFLQKIFDFPDTFDTMTDYNNFYNLCDSVLCIEATKEIPSYLSTTINNYLNNLISKEDYNGANKVWEYMKSKNIKIIKQN